MKNKNQKLEKNIIGKLNAIKDLHKSINDLTEDISLLETALDQLEDDCKNVHALTVNISGDLDGRTDDSDDNNYVDFDIQLDTKTIVDLLKISVKSKETKIESLYEELKEYIK